MLTTRVEQTRLLHEEYEQHSHRVVEDLLTECKTSKQRILTEHRVKERLEKLAETGQNILDSYADVDGARKRELEEITGDNQFTEFYDRLKKIRDFHRNYSGEMPKITNDPPEVKPTVKFAGAELGGRFLDMNALYGRFVNMTMFPKRKETNYNGFLARVDKYADVPIGAKVNLASIKGYKAYIEDVLSYLTGFFARINPLVKLDALTTLIEAEFAKVWANNKLEGWKDRNKKSDKENASNPLYCVPCKKAFSNQNSFDAHLKGKKHAKNVKKHQAGGDKKGEEAKEAAMRGIAKTEYYIAQFADLLREKIKDTQEYVEKKQTRTYAEIAADLEEAEAEEEVDLSDSDDEEEKPIYNPLNLPLGWDGKPIPFWLYKLHGLNIEYSCEICGGYSYWGPRAFERHFTEWRHAYGMRCLGIPNTKEFKHITTFADAIALHEKLEAGRQGSFVNDQEEFEDDEGNVFDKKTFEDLKRQGII
jgi:splicing factor 3A subunit 3